MRVRVQVGKVVGVDPVKLAKVIQAEKRKEAKAVEREFKITVRTWKRQPTFTVEEDDDGVAIGTDNEIYGYVDEGTRPHIITPKRAQFLSFYRTGFVSKTVPNRLNPRAGRSANRNPTRAKVVNHPGTQARNFTKLIAKKSEARLWRNIQKALQQDIGV
jgi:hypothetical protein